MENLYNWNDIKNEIADWTPKEGEFTDVYDEEEIKRDKNRILGVKVRLGIKNGELGVSDSKIQEYAVSQEIGEMDWFHEDLRTAELFPKNNGERSFTVLSSEFDDFVNHTDAVCVIRNAYSDFRPVPFALDMTYNTDWDGLDKKFGWKHPKLKVPGFATIKYYEDNMSPEEPPIGKGRISALPRFVIGFDPELSNEITEARMTTTGWNSAKREELSTKAKWCVLRELKRQAEQMLAFLEEHKDERDYQELYQNVSALNKYFDGAIKTASEVDKEHQDWISYPNRDEVFGAIYMRNIAPSNA